MTYSFSGMVHRFHFPSLTFIVGICFIAILVTGCGDRKKATEQTQPARETAETTRQEVLKTLGGNAITRQLHDMGSAFQKEALHDITRVPHYLQLSNQGAAAVNLGVYMSDLGYLIDFDQQADSKRYFDGCLVLANHIGMGEQFSHAIELRFSEILAAREDLQVSLNRLFEKTSNTASGENFKRMHASALTGYYVEELYHLILMEQHPESNAISPEMRLKALQTLVNQQSGVNNLVSYFDHLQLKPEGILVYQEFLKLQTAYLSLDTQRLQTETSPAVLASDNNLQNIIASLVRIRGAITEL